MSYEIVKYASFDNKRRRVRITACSNNVYPKTYSAWDPLQGDTERYDAFKEAFARALFGGEAQFQPSCKAAAKMAYDSTISEMGGGWRHAYSLYPYWKHAEDGTPAGIDPDLKEGYQHFEDAWVKTYLRWLDILVDGGKAIAGSGQTS